MKDIALATDIKVWWFEVAMGRPLLTPPTTNLDDLRMYTYQAADDSEEKFAGYVTWVGILDMLANSMETTKDAEFVLRNCPPWYTNASNHAQSLIQRLTSQKHYHAYRRELLDTEGTIANFNRQLELTENFEESYEVFSIATHRCPAVVPSIFEKMIEQADTIEQLKEVHGRSLAWYPSKLSSIRKIITLYEQSL